MYDIGDIVLVSKGQDTKFFQVIKVEEVYVWLTDGNIQIRKEFKDVELICKYINREDWQVPDINYFKK